jgi:Family of unknown function (DUF6318)
MNRTLPSARWSCSAAAVLVASVLALAACNGGSTPTGTETTTAVPAASQTPSATPTPTPVYKPADATGKAQNVPVPVLPEAAKAETKEGLEAFAAYWYSALSYAYETGDLSPLNQVTGSACSTCESAKKIITNWNSDGRWLEGGKIITPAVETTFKVASDGNYQVVVQVKQSELRAYKSDGSPSDSVVPASDVAHVFMTQRHSDGWQLVDVQRLNG